MKKRIITGAVFAVVLLSGILNAGWYMMALLGAFMVIGTMEMYRAMRSKGIEPVRWAGYVYCALAIAAECIAFYAPGSMDLSMIALLAGMMLGMTRLVFKGKIAAESMMATVFPMLYPGIFFIALMELLHLDSRAAVVTALVLTFFAASVNDVFALVAGLLLGKHKLSPELSPKKTIEGSIGGLIASTLFAMALPALLRLIFCWDEVFLSEIGTLPPVWAFGVLGFMAGAFSQIGDLTASMFKRHFGVKDFGRLLPGHGGIMDRLDGVLFCGAACYVFFNLTGLG